MKMNRKTLALLVAFVVLLTCSVGSTVAYLVDVDDPVVNEFKPATVDTEIEEKFDKSAKTSIVIMNKGTIEVYVRVMLVANYVDDETGAIIAPGSVTVSPLGTDWVRGEDGYYYYTKAVAAVNGKTSNLLGNMTNGIPIDTTTYPGAHLEVAVLHQSIQTQPTAALDAAHWEWRPTSGDSSTTD